MREYHSKYAYRWLASSLLLVGTIASFSGCETAPVPTAEKSAQEGSAVDRVTAGPPMRKTLRLLTEQPGRVAAFEETPIHSKIAGYIQSVQVDIGDKVIKGQPLITISAPEYRDQLEQKRGLLGQAEAQVQQAVAAVAAAQASANSAKAMVAQTQAAVGRSDAEFARWDSENNRIQQLVSKGSVTSKLAEETASQFQAAQAAKLEAQATIEAAVAKQQEAEAHVNTARADVEAAKAKLRVVQAEIQQAETMLTYTELVSPFDGYVISRNVDTGHYAHPAGSSNASPLMTIANISKVRVFVNVPESEASWVDAGYEREQAGDPVTIQDAAGKTIEARVTRTSHQLDSQSRSLVAEIQLDNSERKLLPGAFVTTKILLEERENVLTLPISAVVKSPNATLCCMVVDGQIQHRPIELGLRVGDEVEVTSDLTGTETVVRVRAGSLQPGQPVEVIPPKT